METNEIPEKTPNSHLSAWQFAGLLIVAFMVGLGAGYLIWAYPLQAKVAALETQAQAQNAQATQSAQTAAQQAEQETVNQAAQPTPQVIRYDVPVDDDAILGPVDAPITIIEFSDYQCPYCQKWHAEVYSQLKAKYGDKIRFVYRDFPLYSIHPEAGPAAEAAQCAGEQSKYYEYHDKLFSGERSLGREAYEAYATDLGLDLANFTQCLDERRYQQEVDADFQFAANLGIESTPTFFINGLALVGAQPFSVFERVIDMELAGEIPQ